MARYIAKLVDHAVGLTAAQSHFVEVAAGKLFDQAFEGTSDGVDVSWGTGNSNDNLVVHFVMDREHSFLKVKWPQANIDVAAGGHTYVQAAGPISGTEIYRQRGGANLPHHSYPISIFHEALHNLFPGWSIDQMHMLDGGGDAAGMAAAHYNVNTPMTEHNKQLMRQGFSVKNAQYF